MNVLMDSYRFANKMHKGQKYNGQSFIRHPVQVAQIIKLVCPLDYELQAAAYLHDILEDTTVTPAELNELFGFNIAGLVFEVTKTGYNVFPNLKTRRGVILKFADRLSNLVNLPELDYERIQRYIEKSRFWTYE